MDFRNAYTEARTITEAEGFHIKNVALLSEGNVFAVVHEDGGLDGSGHIRQSEHAVLGHVQRYVGIAARLLCVKEEKICGVRIVKITQEEFASAVIINKRSAVVDRFSVGLHPSADALHGCFLHERDAGICVRTDVQKKVRADLAAFAKLFDELLDGFEIDIVRNAPVVAERFAHFGGNVFCSAALIHRLGHTALIGDGIDFFYAEFSAAADQPKSKPSPLPCQLHQLRSFYP